MCLFCPWILVFGLPYQYEKKKILFCVQQKKVSDTGFKQHEREDELSL